MRRFLVLCGFIAFCFASASADSIQLANIWGTFTSTQPCQSDCTLTVGINFEFYTTSPQLIQGGWLVFGNLIPGTLRISSSGAGMEPYSYYGGGPTFKEYLTFFNSAGDEMDILMSVLFALNNEEYV